jgi:cytochrome c oxidase subunit 2
MIENLVPQLSTFAGDVDFVIELIGWMVGFWFVLTAGAFFWLLWKFRYREGVAAEYYSGHEKSLKNWITYPHYLIIVCDVFIIIAAVQVWYNVKQTLPTPDDADGGYTTIRATGQQWAWSFVHPGPDGELDTEDDIRTVDELHVQVDHVYHVQLESRDVLHNFSIPVFRLKQDVIPGRRIMGWFEATGTGVYDLQCAEMCGIGHGIMAARIHIETPEEHADWVARNSTANLATR